MLIKSVLFRSKRRFVYLLVVTLITLQLLGVFAHLFEKDYFTEFKYPYDGDIRRSVQQLRHKEHPDIPPINSYNYSFIINHPEKCKLADGEKVRLVYIIKSAPEHFDRRSTIRITWGYEQRFSDVEIRRIFNIGRRDDESLQRKIDNESKTHKDILQSDFVDSYFNNTIKTMMGLKWAVNFCSDARFYMFVDDDYYVSTKNLLRFLRNPVNYPEYLMEPIFSLKKSTRSRALNKVLDFDLPDEVRLYAGYVFFTSPHRHTFGKWKVSLSEYPYHMWPPYVTAGAYVLSREAIIDMYYTSFYTEHFRFDDIYLALLAKKTDIEPFHCKEFYFYKKEYEGHNYEYTIATHGYEDPKELERVWLEQKSSGNA